MTSASPTAHTAMRGVAMMIAAVGIFALLDTSAKLLAGRGYPVAMVAWARYAGNLLLILAWLAGAGALGRLRTRRPGTQVLRGLMLGGATLLYFNALARMPIADAAAIGFVMPLVVALLAVPMLNERLDPVRLGIVLLGLAGAIIIVRPGSGLFGWVALLPLGMALCNAFYQILTRKLSGIEHPMTSLFWGALVGTAMLSPFLGAAWMPPASLADALLFMLLGAFGFAGHLLLIRAYEHATVALLAPLHYSQLVWVLLLGWLLFGEFPDLWSLLGMAVIVVSGLALVNRQRLAVRH
ncbi:MAG TPA: DMT family transporter [Burkholderiales bacterium]